MRTVLCVPGHREEMIKKARTVGADLVLLDLEDSVPKHQKDRAVDMIKYHIKPTDAVRVRDAADLHKFEGLAAEIWVPKLSHFTDLNLSPYALAQGVLLDENPRCLLDLQQRASSGVVELWKGGLAFGAADFALSTGCHMISPMTMQAAQQTLLIGRALGLRVVMSPYTALNEERFVHYHSMLTEAGFDWMGVIHPDQIEWVKKADERHVNRLRVLCGQALEDYQNQDEAVMRAGNDAILAPPIAKFIQKQLAGVKR